jgi:hypothetical protein
VQTYFECCKNAKCDVIYVRIVPIENTDGATDVYFFKFGGCESKSLIAVSAISHDEIKRTTYVRSFVGIQVTESQNVDESQHCFTLT